MQEILIEIWILNFTPDIGNILSLLSLPFLLAGKGTLSFNELINKLDRYVSDIINGFTGWHL